MKIVIDTNVVISGTFFGGYPRTIINAVLIEPQSIIHISRDPDDDKFISCAKDSQALYIVSGDKDLLVLKCYDNIQIITASEFCEKYL